MGINSILQSNTLKISLLFFLISSFFMLIIKDVRKLFNKEKKKAIIYVFVTLLTFGTIGLLSSPKILNNTLLNNFIAFQVLFLILGTIHVWVVRTFFKDLSTDKSKLFNELFFTLAIAFIGLIAFFKVISNFKPHFNYIFLSSIITFIIPVLFIKLYEFALLIPIKVYKQWLYPTGENIKEPTREELKNPLVISFEFTKKEEVNSEVINFRVKAPENLEFGKLFYFFINDYNDRHPEDKIDYLNEDNSPNRWVFYKKPSFFNSLKYINHNKTIIANKLRENNIIICKRT